MTAAGGSNRKWAVDVEKTLGEADMVLELGRWERHCIYRVPASLKNKNPRAYQPQLVSLGPFHHGEPHLLPMEEHKRRALGRFLRRSGRSFDDFAAAVEDVAEELEHAYMDLGDEWSAGRGLGSRERFLEMMILDGCFLLEVMRRSTAAGTGTSSWKQFHHHYNDYAPNDPIFSRHGILYHVPSIRRDMLMLENQLPLLLLHKLIGVELGVPPGDDLINRMVVRFLAPFSRPPTPGGGLRLHPLDVFRRSMLFGEKKMVRLPEFDSDGTDDTIRSAVELYQAGIRFKTSNYSSLRNIRFRRGVLSMPKLPVDHSTEYILFNMVAFERLHVGTGSDTGSDVMAYVFFLDCIIQSPKDVGLLTSKGIIRNSLGSEEAVAMLFHSLARDVVLDPDGALSALLRELNGYSSLPWELWFSNLKRTYFGSPWAFMSLLAAAFLLLMTVLQTVYTMRQFYRDG